MTEITRLGPFATYEDVCNSLRSRGYVRDRLNGPWNNHRAGLRARHQRIPEGFCAEVWSISEEPTARDPLPAPEPAYTLFKSRPEAEADLIANGFRYSKRRGWLENDETGKFARVQMDRKNWIQVIQDAPERRATVKAAVAASKPLRVRLVVPQPRRRAIRIPE